MTAIPLIPRSALFQGWTKSGASFSPDGFKLAYCGADKQGLRQIFVKELGARDARCVTPGSEPAFNYEWRDNEHLLFARFAADENTHVFDIDLRSGKTTDLTPFPDAMAHWILNPNRPDRILIETNRRNPALQDIYEVNPENPKFEKPHAENPGDVVNWYTDNNLQVRGAKGLLPDGSAEIRVRESSAAPWKAILRSEGDEQRSHIIGFSPDGKTAFVVSSVNSDTTRLLQVNMKNGRYKVIVQDSEYDMDWWHLKHPQTGELQAAAVAADRRRVAVLNPEVKPHLDAIQEKLGDAQFHIERNLKDEIWIISARADNMPRRCYLYDPARKELSLLFTSQP